MADGGKQKPDNVVAFKPDARALEKTIRAIAEVTANVGFTDHALERMEQRGITDQEVYRTLRNGFVDAESIEPGKRQGEQVCKVVRPVKGSRDIGVISAVVRGSGIVVVTVQWEDLR